MRVKGWCKFQHFKDRRPPWIKLYRDLLEDPDWYDLSGDDAKTLMMLWLIASETDGELPGVRKLAFRLRMKESAVSVCLKRLSHFLEQPDIGVISPRYHDDAPETERETETYREETEAEGETRAGALVVLPDPYRFPEFWELYPNKVGKPKAEIAYRKALLKTSHEVIIDGLLAYRNKTDDRPWCNPATWLNQERWADQFVEVTSGQHQRGKSFSNALDRLEQYADGAGTPEAVCEDGDVVIPLISHNRR